MKFGVQHGIGDPRWSSAILEPANVIAFAQAAEAHGWSALAFTDHPAPSSRWVNGGGEGSSEPFASLAFCAAVTTRIRLLTWVVVLPYRNPLFAAHQIATVDALSAGRLILGVGTGYLRGEFHGIGADFDHRRAVFDEALEVLSGGWMVDQVEMSGLNFTAPGNVLQPKPLQLPRPPVWIHGNGPWGTDRAARLGDGWVITMTSDALARTIRTAPVPDLKAVSSGVSRLRSALDQAGRPHDCVDIVVSGNWPCLTSGWDGMPIKF
jgi:probable F420-dependent oxidoreductase